LVPPSFCQPAPEVYKTGAIILFDTGDASGICDCEKYIPVNSTPLHECRNQFAPFSWRHMPAAQQGCGNEVVRILPLGRVTCRVQEGIQSLVAPIQCRFFRTQRGLGFETALTYAVLFDAPRSASSLSVVFQPTQSCKCRWLNLTARAALTHYTHEEVAEAVIERLDE